MHKMIRMWRKGDVLRVDNCDGRPEQASEYVWDRKTTGEVNYWRAARRFVADHGWGSCEGTLTLKNAGSDFPGNAHPGAWFYDFEESLPAIAWSPPA